MQCDVRRYFPSIDHHILTTLLRRAVKCTPTLALAGRIIDGYQDPEDHPPLFPGDTLFTAFERPRGLPLGNQTSQFFANIYLNGLDHFVEREIRPASYARYVDDFLLFGDSKAWLSDAREAIDQYLGHQLRLLLHDGKSRVYRTADGVSFLGWRIFPDHRRLLRPNVVRFRRRLREYAATYRDGSLTWADLRARVMAWNGHACHGDTWRLREQLFDAVPLRPKPRK